jgi:hypothetical protein
MGTLTKARSHEATKLSTVFCPLPSVLWLLTGLRSGCVTRGLVIWGFAGRIQQYEAGLISTVSGPQAAPSGAAGPVAGRPAAPPPSGTPGGTGIGTEGNEEDEAVLTSERTVRCARLCG